MCHFISLILPADADEKAVRQLANRSGWAFERIDNEHLNRQLEAGERQFITTMVCDCGTPIGSALRESDEHHDDPARQSTHIAKLKARGWSQAKIDRWLEQQQTVRDREERISQDRLRDGAGGLQPYLDEWITFLRQIVSNGASSCVGLLLHDYRGKLTGEQIKLKGRNVIRSADLTPGALMHVAEDVVYEVRP